MDDATASAILARLMATQQYAAVFTAPGGGLWRGLLFDSLAAAMAGDPNLGGACPGVRRVGFAVRAPGGWWRMKGQDAG